MFPVILQNPYLEEKKKKTKPKMLDLGITSGIKDKFSNSIFMPPIRQHSFVAVGSQEDTTES